MDSEHTIAALSEPFFEVFFFGPAGEIYSISKNPLFQGRGFLLWETAGCHEKKSQTISMYKSISEME